MSQFLSLVMIIFSSSDVASRTDRAEILGLPPWIGRKALFVKMRQTKERTELAKQRLKLYTVRIPSTNSPTSKHYSQLQYKYRPPVKILPLIVLIALGFEAVTATYFVIGVSCDVTRFSFACTTNASMRCGTFFFREAAGLLKYWW